MTLPIARPDPKIIKAVIPEEPGFAGQISCSSLADIIQLHCLAGARASVRVQSAAQAGQLFFDRGQLLHALVEGEPQLSGSEAALTILSWSHGKFERAVLSWPSHAELDVSWQALLLAAAQCSDEKSQAGVKANFESERSAPDRSRLVSIGQARAGSLQEIHKVNDEKIDTSSPTTVPSSAPRSSGVGRVRAPTRAPRMAPSAPSGGGSVVDSAKILFAQAEQAVRLDRSGTVLWAYQESKEFTELCAYITRILDLIADDLSSGLFQSFECDLGEERLLMYAETANIFMALTLPKSVGTSAFKAQLNGGEPWSARSKVGKA